MITHKPRLSIGMPVFNGEDYLEEVLESILTQTFRDFELIICDNASTDRTQEICRAYAAKDQRIRYNLNETNLGAAKNYNFAFELSSGEYFKWASHDDLCAPEFLEKCVAVLDQKPAVVLCYSQVNIINENGNFVDHYSDSFNLHSPKSYERFRTVLQEISLCNAVLGVIRSNVLKKTSLIGNYASSDKVLLGELALRGEFYQISEYLFFRRIHPQASTKTYTTDDTMAGWFDPAKTGKVMAPRWKRFIEYIKAIRYAPLTWHERIRCYIEFARFYLSPQRWSGAMLDLRQIIRVISRFFLKRK